MVGILIMAHAPLGNAFITAARHVFRCMPEHLEAIDVMPDQNPEEVIQLAKLAIARLNLGNGVLVLTDVCGGTPSNCSQKLDALDQVAVLAGLSLPMLLRALTYRHDNLDVVFEMAQAGAQNGAVRVDNRLRIAPG
ncbi:PTS sugar transporter subunit IIA [Solimicrobium silvestre]|uniref:Phosphotransferase system mannose/fructose-specific component IIA n=1 Tax=Solimicrobium silvestre TaxID=2099400 RepID=A0A2S9H015_9BURK|nr:PTS fructose transporter subunit IIA [Solimicrobium silvestre]PRC93288.1 Phosphotransferase system mannose/fructose-specific component IIA [Solimicrobium silvestre]